MLTMISDSNAVWNTLRKEVWVRHHKVSIPLFDLCRNSFKFLLEARYGVFGGFFNEQFFWVFAEEFLSMKMKCVFLLWCFFYEERLLSTHKKSFTGWLFVIVNYTIAQVILAF